MSVRPKIDTGTSRPWPRAMPAGDAASYVSMGTSTFLREVEEGRAPKSFNLTPKGCVRWRRDDLDAWVDDCAARAEDREAPNPWDRPAR